MTSAERVATIEEALALEKAGGRWRVKHAAAISGYSDSFIRNSSCPKHTEKPGPRSKKGRAPVRLIPMEVRTWLASLLDSEQEARVA